MSETGAYDAKHQRCGWNISKFLCYHLHQPVAIGRFILSPRVGYSTYSYRVDQTCRSEPLHLDAARLALAFIS